MPVSVRPAGTICGAWLYPDQKNTYEKLKEFLFESEKGRTDVVFFSSIASAYEGNDWKYVDDGKDNYHYTGGLIDGISKAILQGSAVRAPRKLYASGVFPAYCGNKIPNFDPFVSNTWHNANPNGVGGFLAGAASYYSNWLYVDLQSKPLKESASLNFAFQNTGGATFTSWDSENETFVTTDHTNLWKNAFNVEFPSDTTNSSSAIDKFTRFFSLGINDLYIAQPNLGTSTNLTVLNSTTPEQPQRFWDKEQPWYANTANKFIAIGIGYLDRTTNLIIDVFPDALSYGYVPAGFTNGLTKAQALALDSDITVATFTTVNGTRFVFEGNPGLGSIHWLGDGNDPFWTSSEQQSYYANRQVVVKLFSIDSLSSLLGPEVFELLPNNSTITSYTAWKNCDGFKLNATTAIIRSQWINALNLLSPNGYPLFRDNVVRRKYGLCTSTYPGASTYQIGLPVIFYWGTRDTALRKSGWYNTEVAFARENTTPQDNPLYNKTLPGFPITISTLGTMGFFALDNGTTADIANAASNELFKSRGITIKTDLGKFFDTIETKSGGFKSTAIKSLDTTEKNSILGIFKSNNLKYVVNTYILDYFGNEFSDAGSSFLDPGNINLTIQKRDVGAANPSLLGSQSNIQTFNRNYYAELNSNTAQVKRKANYNRLIKTVDLSTTNASWTVGELRFSFTGDGASAKTKGNFMITSHYVVDANCADGIAFTSYSSYKSFRTGDEAYRQNNGFKGRNSVYLDLFKTLYDRQTDPSLGGSVVNPRKLVLAMEVGIWETANTNFTYNGVNTWQYLVDNQTSGPTTKFGNIGLYSGSFKIMEEIHNTALLAGFKREEIVILYFTPTQLTSSSLPSRGTANGFTLNTEADELALIRDKNKRSSFIRASEVFSNTFLPQCGLFNPCNPYPLTAQDPSSPTFPVKNAVYINLGQISSINSNLTSIDNWEDTWYHRPLSSSDEVAYTGYSEGGALAIGSLFMDYVKEGQATVNFVPPWIPVFSQILNYTTDPVSGATFQFTSVSLDPSKIEPYLVEFDAKCDQGNIQAKRTLSRYKTKILQ